MMKFNMFSQQFELRILMFKVITPLCKDNVTKPEYTSTIGYKHLLTGQKHVFGDFQSYTLENKSIKGSFLRRI